MTHIAAALFFAFALVGAGALLQLTVREYWSEIVAALTGEAPSRRYSRLAARRVRVTVYPRPIAARAVTQRRAAA